VQKAYKYMPPGSSIIFMSTGGSFAYPKEFTGIYAVSKSALNNMTKAIANDLQKEKIRVNCIAPGIIKTEFSQKLWKSDETRE
jgi:dehydrogenase/reductase SDR family protein 4